MKICGVKSVFSCREAVWVYAVVLSAGTALSLSQLCEYSGLSEEEVEDVLLEVIKVGNIKLI